MKGLFRNWTSGNSSHQCGVLRRLESLGVEGDTNFEAKQVLSNCRQRVPLTLLANGRNTWARTFSSQELVRREACFGVLIFLRSSGLQASDLPEECRFLLSTQLMFMKNEKDPTTKQFDDDEWIRSLTEAQEVTADIQDDCVTHDWQDVDPWKSLAHTDGRVLAEIRLAATLGTR